MKKLSIIIIISFFTVMACNDEYLEKYPLDQVSDKVFWSTGNDIKMYANQFYPDIELYAYCYRNDANSDNMTPSSRDSYSWNESTPPQTGGGWSWGDIRACNYALVRIADMEKDAEIMRYEGEIRFFKSYYYLEKIKRFGDVPWLDKDLQTDSEELYKARDSREAVFANLLEDLDFAIAHLPATKYIDDRLTKYAALALKTEACLYEGTFRKYHGLGDHEAILREAVNAAEEVINSGLFDVFSTGNPDNDFYDMFLQEDLTGNPETILCAVLLENIKMNNRARNASGYSLRTGYSKDFVDGFLCKDGLPISVSPLYQGDEEFEDQFVNRDPRFHQSIYNHNLRNPGEYTLRQWEDQPIFSARESLSGFRFIKWFPRFDSDRVQNKNTVDDYIFRYSELLLSYAEAKAELGECTQSVLDKSINLIRDRVDMPHLTVDVGFVDPDWPDWEVPVSPLINEIRRERRIELCAEGKRWDDLVRWKAGKRLEAPKTILGARDPETGEYRVIYPGKTRTWNDKLYLHPIPLQEIALNKNLVQNPGWEQ